MATLASDTRAVPHRLGILRLAFTGALSATAFAVLCWVGARLGLGPVTHMYLQLFTTADTGSALALLIAVCASFVAGLVAGGLIAFFYNVLEWLDGR